MYVEPSHLFPKSRRAEVIKFDGCYHGHADSFLVAAGSGVATLGLPDSPGVTKGASASTLVATYNDLDSVKKLFEANKGEAPCAAQLYGTSRTQHRRRFPKQLASSSAARATGFRWQSAGFRASASSIALRCIILKNRVEDIGTAREPPVSVRTGLAARLPG